ncbi:MAG: hypothetical protein ACOH5I_23355 [Oligoflexus sp.]
MELFDLDHNEDTENESFWPSFADIMMVIVIIFLMVMVVLVSKNWNLMEKLRQSLLAEQQSSVIIEETTEKNQTLASQLADAENQISLLNLRLMELQNEQAELKALSDTQSAEIAKLQESNLMANLQITDLSNERQMLRHQLHSQEQILKEREQIIVVLKNEAELKNVEFVELQKKYDKLIRPARTATGKVIAEITYDKNGGQPVYELKTPDFPRQAVSLNRLNEVLGKLKAKYPDKLYLKLIFPQGSRVSHDEAWRFTSQMLSRYDYYYQD